MSGGAGGKHPGSTSTPAESNAASLTPERLVEKLSAAFKLMLQPRNISHVC